MGFHLILHPAWDTPFGFFFLGDFMRNTFMNFFDLSRILCFISQAKYLLGNKVHKILMSKSNEYEFSNLFSSFPYSLL